MDRLQLHVVDVADRALRWIQPRTLSPFYELHADDTLVATLTFRTTFSSLATGESRDGCWTFKRQGFIATRVSIRRCESEQDVAVFRNSTWAGGGTLELPDRRTYRASSNFWQTRYEITNGDSLLLTFARIGGILHLSSDVAIQEAAKTLPELPWLVMLGWYLTVMQQPRRRCGRHLAVDSTYRQAANLRGGRVASVSPVSCLVSLCDTRINTEPS